MLRNKYIPSQRRARAKYSQGNKRLTDQEESCNGNAVSQHSFYTVASVSGRQPLLVSRSPITLA